ncbi:hypothetical protein Pelo_19578 [Pelomyxa schiedti]|nr:hypothetical protein Pelo_19578 [Pelomyxa schiedti]
MWDNIGNATGNTKGKEVRITTDSCAASAPVGTPTEILNPKQSLPLHIAQAGREIILPIPDHIQHKKRVAFAEPVHVQEEAMPISMDLTHCLATSIPQYKNEVMNLFTAALSKVRGMGKNWQDSDGELKDYVRIVIPYVRE